MDDRMVDSEMLGNLQSYAFDEGCTAGKNKLINYIEGIRDWLRNLAEDKTLPIDVKVYTLLWQEIQSIDHGLAIMENEGKNEQTTKN